MKRLQDLPIQKQVLGLVAISFLAAVVVAAGLLLIYEQTTFESRATASGQSQAETLAAILEDALLFKDDATAGRYLGALRSRGDVAAAAVFDSDGDLFAAYEKDHTDVVIPTVHPDAALGITGDILRISVPVFSDRNPVGHVWLEIYLPPLSERLTAYGPTFAAALSGLVILSLSVSLLIRRAITEPVHRLAETARQVARHQDFSLRADVGTGGEIRELTKAFNGMLDTTEARGRSLKESEERFRRAFENAPVGVCLTSTEGRLLRVNRTLCEMLGYTADELCIKKFGEITHPDDVEASTNSVKRLLAGEIETIEIETRYVHRDGPAVWAAVHAILLRHEDGSPMHFVTHVVDISAHKAAEAERERLETQLLQSQKMEALGTLSGGIAHDFNNVITAITGNSTLALEDIPGDHPAFESIEEIRLAARRASEMVRRILAFSRAEEPDLQPTALRPVIEEAVKLLRSTIPAMIDIRFECDENPPLVLADPTQIHQVIMNLGTNARDAMAGKDGSLTFRLRPAHADTRLTAAAPELPPGPCACISVTDNGSGMPPETLERIFDPFFTTKPQGVGTGMGLSVVHGIMRRHKGAVLATSESGEGTTFDLYIPAAPCSENNSPATTAAAQAPRPTVARGQRILYIDDEEPLVFLSTRMLRKMGYEVEGCSDPRKALDLFSSDPRRADLVITDLGMPGMSGLDLVEQLLKIRPDLPIIVTSGFVRADDIRRAKELGIPEIILKPNTVEEMADTIHERLSKDKSRDEK